ncbi:MAG: carbamoyltransferase HypF [Desulfurococcaceae archaeon]
MSCENQKQIAVRLLVIGLVQGVGFRPFVSRLATGLDIYGYVRNVGGSEVEIWIEGPEDRVYEFLLALHQDKPVVALLDQVYMSIEEPRGYTNFSIEKSHLNAIARSNIPPDFAICKDCLAEVLDPQNRRYRYLFNSCAWCGPRFSMIYRVPYDRENTAMNKYVLCDECLREYDDPGNLRRYHAEGISCPRDGPRVYLLDKDFKLVDSEDPVYQASKLIDEGFIVAVKGIGGYHIAALASNDDVVLELRRRKKRPHRPFAIMGLNTDVLRDLVHMDEVDEALLNSPQAPILLLPKKEGSPVSKYVSPGLYHEGVFVAYTALHYLLLMNTRDKFLVMTSGNVSGEPMCTDEECAKSRLSRIVDYFLVHDRVIVNRVDDSVIRKTGDQYLMIRRSRGYAPMWINLNRDLGGEFIAFGGDLASAGAVGFENRVVLTQYIGDLDSIQAQKEMLKYVDFLARNYNIGLRNEPYIVVDMHPQLHSRRLGLEYAKLRSSPWIEIQHHYAHVLGAAVDNGLEGTVAGIATDGVGWGTDGTIWGCEVVVFNTESYGFKRIASINPLPLTGDRDTYIPLRLLCAYYSLRGVDLAEILKYMNVRNGKEVFECKAAHTLVKLKRYTPASSTGRLLDLVASILNPGIERTYEGEPAIWLEAEAWRGSNVIVIDHFKVRRDGDVYRLDYDSAVDWLVEHRSKYDAPSLARGFLYSLGNAIGSLLLASIKGTRVDYVVMSGGASVNEFMHRGIRDRLREEGLYPYLPRRIPPNDGGLAFGQVVAASLKIKETG